jgi:hypothetical protein
VGSVVIDAKLSREDHNSQLQSDGTLNYLMLELTPKLNQIKLVVKAKKYIPKGYRNPITKRQLK